MKAVLRVCASCEWIFRGGVECPKCRFGSYGARHVYGPKAYRYEKQQTPWSNKKLDKLRAELAAEISRSNKDKKPCLYM